MRVIALLVIAIAVGPTVLSAASSSGQVRIAIVPFEAIDRPSTADRLADAQRVSEGLREHLSTDPALDVVPTERMSAFAPDADPGMVARQLGADFIVSGSSVMGYTARTDQSFRIHYALFDAAMGTEIWSQNFEQDYAEFDEMVRGTAQVIRRAIPQRAFPAQARASGSGFQPLPINPGAAPAPAPAARSGPRMEATVDGVVVADSEDDLERIDERIVIRATGEPLTGVMREWHPNGQLRYEGSVQDGYLHGRFSEWGSNGEVRQERTYDMGDVLASNMSGASTPADRPARRPVERVSGSSRAHGQVRHDDGDERSATDRERDEYPEDDARVRQGQGSAGRIDSNDDRRLTPVDPPPLSRAEEERTLRDAGMDLSDARLWLNEGFTAYEVLGWRPFVSSYRHAGRNNLEEATNWWRWGWTPDLADHFINGLCGRYQQAADYGDSMDPYAVIDRFGDQCRD